MRVRYIKDRADKWNNLAKRSEIISADEQNITIQKKGPVARG